jgi:hypothetical protein
MVAAATEACFFNEKKKEAVSFFPFPSSVHLLSNLRFLSQKIKAVCKTDRCRDDVGFHEAG